MDVTLLLCLRAYKRKLGTFLLRRILSLCGFPSAKCVDCGQLVYYKNACIGRQNICCRNCANTRSLYYDSNAKCWVEVGRRGKITILHLPEFFASPFLLADTHMFDHHAQYGNILCDCGQNREYRHTRIFTERNWAKK